jgi:hypothetical protein
MKIIIAGSRDFDDYKMLERYCDHFFRDKIADEVTILCGMSKGADLLGRKYAISRGFNVKEYPADWETHGKAAGPIRNAEMADNADGLIAFYDGESKGTGNMIKEAEKRELQVCILKYN